MKTAAMSARPVFWPADSARSTARKLSAGAASAGQRPEALAEALRRRLVEHDILAAGLLELLDPACLRGERAPVARDRPPQPLELVLARAQLLLERLQVG